MKYGSLGKGSTEGGACGSPYVTWRGISCGSVTTNESFCSSEEVPTPCGYEVANNYNWSAAALDWVQGQTTEGIPWLNYYGGLLSAQMDYSTFEVYSSCIYDAGNPDSYCYSNYGPSLGTGGWMGVFGPTSCVEYGAPFNTASEINNSGASAPCTILISEGLLVTPVSVEYAIIQCQLLSVYNSALDDSGKCNDLQLTILQVCQGTSLESSCYGCAGESGGTLIELPLPGSLVFPTCENSDKSQPTAGLYTFFTLINPALTTAYNGNGDNEYPDYPGAMFRSVNDAITNTEWGLKSSFDMPVLGWSSGDTPGACPLDTDDPP